MGCYNTAAKEELCEPDSILLETRSPCTRKGQNGYKHDVHGQVFSSNQTKEATIETTKMYKQDYVTRQIAQQHPTEVVTAVTMAWSDFELLMTGLVNEIFSKMRRLH